MVGMGEWASHSEVMSWVDYLNLPPYAIKSRFFPFFWGVMYVMVGIAFGVMLDQKELNEKGLMFFILMLIMSFVYSPVLFEFKKPILAFYILVFIAISLALTIITSHRHKIMYLLVPYVLWIAHLLFVHYYLITHNRF